MCNILDYKNKNPQKYLTSVKQPVIHFIILYTF
jgi:hypothetical protein